MKPNNTYEAIVVGGALAGACAAFHLARQGVSVLILEKETQAHHKVCGEFLSAAALPYLEAMHVDLLELGAEKLNRFQIHSKNFQHRGPLPGESFGISRFKLDEACLNQAQAAGAELERGVAVSGFRKEGERFVVTSSDGREWKSSALFLAHGKHEIQSIQKRQGKERSAIGFKMQLRLSQAAKRDLDHDIAMCFFKGGYAGLCAIEEGLSSLCFIIEKEIYKKVGGDFEASLNYLQEQNPRLKQLIEAADFAWAKPLAIAQLPYGYLHRSNPQNQDEKIYYLGDQFAVIPSITGSGMSIALYTGKQAALDYIRSQRGEPSRYQAQCSELIRQRMRLAYPLHRLCQSALLADLCTLALKPFPQWAQSLVEKIGMYQSDLNTTPY